MIWLISGILSAFFLAFSSNLDQLSMRYFFNGQASEYRLFLGFSRFVFLPFFLFMPSLYSYPIELIAIMLSIGGLGFFVILPYTKALEIEESSRLVPLFQLTPIAMFIILYLWLGETITIFQGVGCILMIISAFCLLVDFKTLAIKKLALGLMMLTVVGFSFSSVIRRYVLVEDVPWVGLFLWMCMGKFLYSFCVFSISRKYREFAVSILTLTDKRPIITIITHQISTNLGQATFVLSMALAPAGVLTQSLNGLQPIFVLVTGFAFAKLFPDYFNSPKTKHEFAWYVMFLMLMLTGVMMIYKINI